MLAGIPLAERSKKVKERTLDTPLEDRALGVYWHVEEDRLGFQVKQMDKPLTKRGILSMVSSVYDPLGIAGPFILKAKKILQDLCQAKLDWDEPVSKERRQEWLQWLEGLEEIADLHIPRCAQPPNVVERQLHHFADASEVAYGVVSYLRTVDTDGRAQTALLMAKSRLAPIKPLTIPRLELQAATLATRQDALLRRELGIKIDRSQFWTDSTIVLQYVRNTEARYHTFVANRVAEIHERTSVEDWRHVPTRSNPADDASRGVPAPALTEPRWLRGPSFLTQPPEEWPVLGSPPPLDESYPEVKRSTTAANFAANGDEEIGPVERLAAYYSRWPRLLRALAWIILLPRAKLRGEPRPEELQPEHLDQAEEALVAHIQGKSYGDEVAALRGGQKVAPSSPLKRLQPGLRGRLLVTTGRLTHSGLPDETKRPVILPSHHPAVEALIRHTHESTAHSGREYVLADLRQKYWIVGAAPAVRRILGRCVYCRKRAAKPCVQLEADLPADRVTPGSPAFTNVGVDFFGPILVQRGRGREKRYGCLFTCLTTRAVHLKVADGLGTDSFMNCLYRFMSRRGEPSLIRSDNGTNFVGAEREIRQELAKWDQGRIRERFGERRIKWLFNPPSASHMGGVWERQIRTVRRTLAGLTTEQENDPGSVDDTAGDSRGHH